MKEFFPGISRIKYEGPKTKNPLAFRCYNAGEKVGKKTMAEHLRFSVVYWHTMKGGGTDPFGPTPVYDRPWDVATDPMQRAEDTMRAAFEFTGKLGAPFWAFHDRDIAPEGDTLAESNTRLDQIVRLARKLQRDTGIKLLWGTSNCFSHERFTHGAGTNPDPHVFAWAAAQIKKAMECTKDLGGVNYVFWGGREGYSNLLNTELKQEQDQMARLLHMAVEHKKKIGFKGTLLIEPKPKEPTKHQYDYDAATVLSFLRTYDLIDEFSLNLEANHATLAGHTFEHDLTVASAAGRLGSIDANRGDLLLGWDTDQFPTDLYSTTYAMMVILKQGGLKPGGVNFDAKLRRGSFDLDDLFHAHIGGMDAFARGLKIAHRIMEDGQVGDFVKRRYAGWRRGMGRKVLAGKASFEDMEAYVHKHGEAAKTSGREEWLEALINSYL
ncbi:MAG TPA: xylose isomerase [Candidatus Latescibacteria bacterium]|jgi:xylose isomerase|nr:xylose isomerase [Gemmatimonadota bacterium]MDP7364177.1 xylose isomerase [Candidatus Latescibacterota bacterium]HJN28348.1 xylose isomerase [Candidatus Latescibacterota bacterium]